MAKIAVATDPVTRWLEDAVDAADAADADA